MILGKLESTAKGLLEEELGRDQLFLKEQEKIQEKAPICVKS